MKGINRPGTKVIDDWKWLRTQLPPDAFEALRYLSESTGESFRSIARRAVIAHLHEAGFPHLTVPETTATTRKATNHET